MSSRCQTHTILKCDNCGTEITSMDAGIDVASAPAVRSHAARNGWRFVATILPMPPDHRGRRDSTRRQFDFCDQCGVPEEIHTTITALVDRPAGGYMDAAVPVTILSGVVVYGQECP